MPTGKQVRAARALLSWDIADLATKAGIRRETVSLLENNVTPPRSSTINKIVRVFNDAGIEFLGNDGVRKRPEGIEIFEGYDRFQEFYDFLYSHLKQNGGEVCLSIYNETLLAKYRKNPEYHRKRMKELVDQGDVTFRILATKSDFNSRGYATFKWQPEHHAAATGFYAFDDCLALISFVDEQSPYVIVIQSAPMAEGYRQTFNVAWQHASPPPSAGGK